MAIIRVNHNKNYTVMSNFHLRDRDLSLKAKGLLSQMLSLPPEWDYTVAGLVAINSEKQAAITSALKELQQHGYLIITKKMPNETKSGRIEYIYDIYEQKQTTEKQGTEKQGIENQGLEFQVLENPTQINIEEINTDKLNTYKKRTDYSVFKPPTLAEVEAYCNERKNGINPQRFVDYYAARGWMVGKSKMRDWKAAVRLWEQPKEKPKNTEPDILDGIL